MNRNPILTPSCRRLMAAFSLAAMPIATLAQTTRDRRAKEQVQHPRRYPARPKGRERGRAPVPADQRRGRSGVSHAASATGLSQRSRRSFSIRNSGIEFKWVNASDLNAFALPGGPMYVNRGMLEKANNEGELAGVMAHELSHVALRHATAQATKNSSAGNTAAACCLILGGAAVGGQAGARARPIAAQSFMLKYSREYESQADALGAIIMARAGLRSA